MSDTTLAVPPAGRGTDVGPDWPLASVLEWLAHEGRLIGDLAMLIAELAERLVSVGAPVWRIYVGLQTIHPQLRAQAVIWRRDEGVSELARRHGIEFTAAFIDSPVDHARRSMQPVRHRLVGLPADAHSLLQEVAAAGGTDYVCHPLAMAQSNSKPVISLATDRAGGWGEGDVAALAHLVEHLAPLIELHVGHRVASIVADTYLGMHAGQRVLDGSIRRGDGEEINAVLWFSDLRDYTRISERLPPDRVLAMLNAYYEIVGGALKKHGGEILKFIGDGVMAIFPIVDAMFLPAAASGAVEAAKETIAGVATLNRDREAAGEPAIRFGVGLHVGLVTWGNVGTEDRLDFTVIGPAVNRCARLESLTKALGHPVLTSAEFQNICTMPLHSLGQHRLRGVPQPVEVFTLDGS